MDILLYIVVFIVGGLLNFVIKHRAELVYRICIIYIFLVLLVSADAWLFYFGGIKNAFFLKMLAFLLDWGKSLGRLMLGYLIVNILFALRANETAEEYYHLRKITAATLWGLSILTGNTFLIATVGKAENMTEMRLFFTTSGYAIWFLYFIMIAEALGGLGVLLHFKLKTGIMAAAGLMLIMIGALYTHCHNNDPLSDSYAAITQFMTLSLMQVLYYFEKQVNAAASQHFVAITQSFK